MTRRLEEFCGVWRIERFIEDAREGARSRLAGRAVLTPTRTGLSYREQGTLVLPDGTPLVAEREYLWRDAPGGIAVDFPDGRHFHTFDPALDQSAACHLCDPDRYHAQYDFSGWPNWSLRWTVTGPRKEYVATTRYRRG